MTSNNKKNNKKRSELVVINLEEKEANFDKIIEEGKKILEITQKDYTNIVHSAEAKLTKSRKDIVLEAGKYLENNLEIVTHNSPNYICRMLKQKFKGIINPTAIWHYCPEKWKSAGRSESGRKGGLAKSNNFAREIVATKSEEPLTEYEQKYVKVHEDKVYHNENVENLINYYLGMTEQEKINIYSKAKRKGSDYHTVLIEEAYDNMLRIVKSLNDADIPALLADIRFIKQILTKVADIALAEHEVRKQNKDMMKA